MWTGPFNEVLVSTFDLEVIDAVAVSHTLSADEHDRAARFRFDHHRHRYVAGRGTLRMVLGNLINKEPETLQFSYGAHGKPHLQGIHFNLSHSDHRAVLAVTHAAPVGVDIEIINPDRSRPELARRFFALEEIKALERLSTGNYADAFFQLWARKEAVLKAVGTGIGGGLSSFAVPLDAMPQPVHISAPDCWIGNLAHAFPYLQTEGFSSAVALLAHEPLIRPVCGTVFRIPVRRTFK